MNREQTTQNTCAITHCRKPSPDLTICHGCVDDVETELTKFTRPEIDRLYAIAYGLEQSADRTALNQTAEGETPPDALTLGVWELANNIAHHWPAKLPYLAKDPEAKTLYWQIINGCQTAQRTINGDPKEYANGDIREVNRELATPKTIDGVIEWAWERFDLRITKKQIYNWTHRGKLRAYKIPGMQHKLYRPKDVLEHV